MLSTSKPALYRPVHWGLAEKPFTTLILTGATAVLVTAVLGHVRARNTLEKVVFDQLTTARQTKARQVETYFRTVNAEARLLASSKMVVDATREFRAAVNDLDRAGTPSELHQKVSGWYAEHFIPETKRVLGRESDLTHLPPGERCSSFEAMMTMRKIDIARIEAAERGVAVNAQHRRLPLPVSRRRITLAITVDGVDLHRSITQKLLAVT